MYVLLGKLAQGFGELCCVTQRMTKQSVRSKPAAERRLRIRLALRTVEIWRESGYNKELERFALRAIAYLKQIGHKDFRES